MGSKIVHSRFGSDFLEQYHNDGNDFLNHITCVTGIETCISFVNGKTREQWGMWIHTHSSNKLKKLMATVFWGRKRVLTEFTHQGTAISEVIAQQQKLNKTNQNNRFGMSEC
jgi:hypothetical protein